LRSMLPREKRVEKLMGRDYQDYCNCNEDTCWDSPPCCVNGSCPAENGAPSRGALEAAWVGVLAMGVAVAGII
jgi:hypothetical protein